MSGVGLVARYLDLLQVEPGTAPSLEALTGLHRAHVERVPYSTLELVLGHGASADEEACVRRVVERRGGFCFHLNGAFAWLLDQLGYDVRRHVAGVQARSVDAPVGANGNHLSLTVGLPGQGRWMVDVGLGTALHGPLRLVEGTVQDGAFRFGLRSSGVVPDGWRFDHDPRAESFAGVDVDVRTVSLPEATLRHDELACSPTSPFVRRLSVQRRDADGLDSLTGVGLRRIGATAPPARVLGSPEELAEVLTRQFGLDLAGAGINDAEVAGLYERERAATEAFLQR